MNLFTLHVDEPFPANNAPPPHANHVQTLSVCNVANQRKVGDKNAHLCDEYLPKANYTLPFQIT
jgi:hypothetical protein